MLLHTERSHSKTANFHKHNEVIKSIIDMTDMIVI